MRGSLFVDGFLRGTWRLDSKTAPTVLHIGLHEPLEASQRDEVEAEAGALLDFASGGAATHHIEWVALD